MKKKETNDIRTYFAKIKNKGVPRGDVKCAKLVYHNTKEPQLEGYETINVCSKAKDQFKSLSPFLLGPFYVQDEGIDYISRNMENMWQFSKVFIGEEENGRPTEHFFERRNNAWESTRAHRHVKKGEKVLYHWWNGNKFNYIEARKNIYCPYYANKVKELPAYKNLLSKLEEGKNILIVGYDGYDFGNKSFDKCFLDESRPFGHELVLCSILRGEEPWNKSMEELHNSVSHNN